MPPELSLPEANVVITGITSPDNYNTIQPRSLSNRVLGGVGPDVDLMTKQTRANINITSNVSMSFLSFQVENPTLVPPLTISPGSVLFSGVSPAIYETKEEPLNVYRHDDPMLKILDMGLRVTVAGVTVYHHPRQFRVYSRFDYLMIIRPGTQTAGKEAALEFVKYKYNIHYSPSEADAVYAGASSESGTIAATNVSYSAPLGGPILFASFAGTEIYDEAFNSERQVASTLIHENSHYTDGVTYGVVFLASAAEGQKKYKNWVAGGYSRSLSQYEVGQIAAWTSTEQGAIIRERTNFLWSHMSAAEQGEINHYWDTMQAVIDDMAAHGY